MTSMISSCRGQKIYFLREDATTYLFSNYPLPGFEQRSTKELPTPQFNIFDGQTTNSSIQNTLNYGMVSGSF